MADQKAGMELVDGRLGMPHIDSTDMSLIHTGLYGNGGDYVITGLSAGYADGSSVSITPGVGMIQGLFFTVTTTQTVSLANGSTVYVHYHHDTANDVETVDLVSGSGLDAGTVQGGEDAYMPLYSVAGSSATLLAKKLNILATNTSDDSKDKKQGILCDDLYDNPDTHRSTNHIYMNIPDGKSLSNYRFLDIQYSTPNGVRDSVTLYYPCVGKEFACSLIQEGKNPTNSKQTIWIMTNTYEILDNNEMNVVPDGNGGWLGGRASIGENYEDMSFNQIYITHVEGWEYNLNPY